MRETGVQPPPPPALEVKGLEIPFGSQPGLAGISFQVARGERFALVGASGAGKTSLLNALSGSGPVTAGSVRVEGREVTTLPSEKRGTILLSQRPLLFPHLSVFENVAFPLRVRGLGRSEIGARVEEALAAVRMEGFASRTPSSLSGGQAHRVALARAVVARPPVLLLDEPLTSLDPTLREEVRQSILAVQAEYRPALVLVTHDLGEAGRMADRLGVLLNRRLAQVGTPEALFRRPASAAVARFLGLPNDLPGQMAPDGSLFVAGWRVSEGGLAAADWRVGDAPGAAPSSESRPVRILCGAEAGRFLSTGSGGIPARVEEVRHHPEGAVARVTLRPCPGMAAGFPPTDAAAPNGAAPPASVSASASAPAPASASPASALVSVDPLRPPPPGEMGEVVFRREGIHVFEE